MSYPSQKRRLRSGRGVAAVVAALLVGGTGLATLPSAQAVPTPSVEREAMWRLTLSHYYQAYGIDPDTIPVPPARAPFTADVVELLTEFTPAVSPHGANPRSERRNPAVYEQSPRSC